ncbi:MAG: hypothetical protein PHI90_09960 [Clostridia bacterium]|nr:hypothetical protein [Clostridia bacterium]MDD4049114.1 hypothetical protein [Clostridia bacterium]
MIISGKNRVLLLVLILLSLTIIMLGCDKQNGNEIKVDASAGNNNESEINEKQPEPEEESKSSGILLGIKSRKLDKRGDSYNSYTEGIRGSNFYEEKPQYKTLYITNNKGNVALSTQGSGVLVPRNNDFWLLNIETEKDKDKYKDFNYNSNVDFISAKKVNSSAVKKFTKEYKSGELAKKWYENYYSGDPKYFSNDIGLELIFVGCDYITQRVTDDGYNGGVRGRCAHWLTTIPFNETNKIDVYDDYIREIEGISSDTEVKEVDISEVLGNDVETQFLEIGNKYLENTEYGDSYCLQGKDGWGFFRQNSKWMVKGYILCSSGCGRGIYGIFNTDIVPPNQIVSHDTLIPAWDAIKTSIPDAKDAFSSPEKDMLIVLTTKELRVYTDFRDDYIGEVAYVIDLGDIIDSEEEKEVDVIMAQWATGDYVEKWENEAKKYLKE